LAEYAISLPVGIFVAKIWKNTKRHFDYLYFKACL
jgi:hypothetical protein